jgi:restriction system-associated AAA family ATPase
MRLLRAEVISAATCGGLLDGFGIQMKSPSGDNAEFSPVCLIGPNGAGKSQFLQVLAEMFQSVFHTCLPDQERREGNPDLQFALEYQLRPKGGTRPEHVRISRRAEGNHRPRLKIERRADDDWVECKPTHSRTARLLPSKVVGYTSGDNETLSLPFLISRGGYAEEVGTRALDESREEVGIPDTRLMLVDYATHLEVLVANLMLGDEAQRNALLQDARVADIHSFRCIVQLAHSAAPTAPAKFTAKGSRKGILLTQELENYIDHLQRCSTCHSFDPKTETYVFDFWVNDASRKAFRSFYRGALDLYSAFHKLAMLNDLVIPKATRERFRKDTKSRRFASRLPEPQDEDKVFRFERVTFAGREAGNEVDYVSLSDGEHQLVQLLGTLCMLSFPNVLFLLDEPESHFNPQWRVKFLSRIKELPTQGGIRKNAASDAAQQECLLSTHSPFVPSDMPRDSVFVFEKEGRTITARRPDIETYGTTFDSILEECFGVRPPISDTPKAEIKALMKSEDPEEIREGLERLGDSIEKVFLSDRLQQLLKLGDK